MGALVVYDITDVNSFNNVKHWLKELRDHTKANIVGALMRKLGICSV